MKITVNNDFRLMLAAAILAAATAHAGFITNPSFEATYNETWPHYGAVDGWTGVSGANNSTGPFHNNGTPIPDGAFVGFKQGSGDMTQELSGLTAGKRYVIQFAYDARGCCGGAIDLLTKINGVELDKIANVKPVAGGDPFRLRTVAFTAESDTATLTLSTVSSGDATILVDAVTVVQRDANQLAIFNASFEASGDVADSGLLTPNGLAGWGAEGQYGINVSGAGPSANNGTARDQEHVVFIQGLGAIRQSVRMVSGKPYQLSFAYNAKTGNSPRLQVKVGSAVVLTEDVAPVGGTAAYRTKTVNFTSTDVSAVIEFAQIKDGDHTVLIDDVKISGEQPAAVDPVSLSPEVAELGLGEQLDLIVKAPADALAVKDVVVVLQSSAPNAIRFVDPSGPLTQRTEVRFTKGGPQEKSVKIQGLARGSGNLQVVDSGGLPIRNQVAATVVTSALKNPSFDSTPAAAGVGYSAIPGWIGGSGMNAAGQPFADNGIIPDRKQVAFLQGASALSQEVRGLVPGKSYWLQFFYNIRNCCPAGDSKMGLTVNLGGKELLNIADITAVGDATPYNFQNVAFVATSATAVLEFKTTPTGDATFLLDGVTVVQRDPGQIVVRNPSFEASGSLFPFPGYFDAVAGWTVSGGGRGANIDGVGPFTDNGRANAGDLVLFLQGNGSSVSQNLTGLTDGKKYLVGLLMNARNGGAEETGIVVSFNDTSILEENFSPVGGANPYYVRQATFTAAGTEGILKLQGVNGGGDHTLLVDNVVVVPETGSAPVILSEPAPVIVASGGSASLGVSAVGGGTLSYLWKRGGQNVTGGTASTLVLENITPALAGSYTVEVKNSNGTSASAPAKVTVLESIPGLFDSGVGADHVVLGDGATDPHYTLVQNADNAQSKVVYAQDASLFPIVAGPWLANGDLSRWVGPRADPSAATAGGVYVYRTTLDLTGFDPATVVFSGTWASDNSAELVINGVGTGATQSGFGGFNTFTTTGGFKAGINQIDFKVTNGDSAGGPTGLRLESLTALGAKGAAVVTPPKFQVVRSGGNVTVTAVPASLPAGFVLQTATSVTGPWVTQAGQNTPFTAPIGAGNVFLRAIKP